MAFHPLTPEIMYVGTGDPQISGHPRIGAGHSNPLTAELWTSIGLEDTRIVSRIELDPFDPNVVFAATMGNPSMPDPIAGCTEAKMPVRRGSKSSLWAIPWGSMTCAFRV